MDSQTSSLLQLIPPLVVIAIILAAGFFFYTRYVVNARSLCDVIRKTSATVRSMSDGDEMMRKTGVSRVFQGTPLELVWRDFSKTLHTQVGYVNGVKQQKKFRITVPAQAYFSVSSVVDRPLGVDYFKHLPGILTGVGIIGTFSGLLFGLSNFDASSAEKMNHSIALLLGGVRDAFYASAAAITAAMIITHVEKLHYRRCLSALDDLVDALNGLFEAGVGEEYLSALVNQSNNSSEIAKSLKDELLGAMVPVIRQLENIQSHQVEGLAEAIGNQFTPVQRKQIKKLFLAGGVSFNQAKISKDESRRVELRLQFHGLTDDTGQNPANEFKFENDTVEKCFI